MGLFDYDARPATPQVQLVGDRSSAAAYALRDFSRETDFPTTGRRWMALETPSIPPIYHSASSATVRELPTRNRVPTTMIDLSLEPNATFEQDLPPAYNGFFYILDGSVQVGGDPIAASQVGWLAPSSSRELVISAQDNGARLVLYAGQPLGEPLTLGGPFVAGAPSEILDFNGRFRADEFISMSELAKSERVADAHRS